MQIRSQPMMRLFDLLHSETIKDKKLLQEVNQEAEKIISKLVQSNISLNETNKAGWPLLMLAAFRGYAEITQFLLDAKANPDLAEQKTAVTPLLAAVREGHATVTKILLEAKAKPDTKALMKAAEIGNSQIITSLLDKKINPDIHHEAYSGETPLRLAAIKGHSDAIITLLSRKANPNLFAKNNGTALMVAANCGKSQVIDILMKSGADPNLLDKETGWSALMYAASGGYLDIVNTLITSNANINVVGKNIPFTALLLAIQQSDLDITQALLDKKADPNFINKDNYTPLTMAANYNNIDIMQLLLDRHANPNLITPNGSYPLRQAVVSNNKRALAILLKGGAKITSYEEYLAESFLSEYKEFLTEAKCNPASLQIKTQIQQPFGYYILYFLEKFLSIIPPELNELIANYAIPSLSEIDIDQLFKSSCEQQHYLSVLSPLIHYPDQRLSIKLFLNRLSLNDKYHPIHIIYQIEEELRKITHITNNNSELYSILIKIQTDLLRVETNAKKYFSEEGELITKAENALHKKNYDVFFMIWKKNPDLLCCASIRELFTGLHKAHLKNFLEYLDAYYYKTLPMITLCKVQENHNQSVNRFIQSLSLPKEEKLSAYQMAANGHVATYRDIIPHFFNRIISTSASTRFLKEMKELKQIPVSINPLKSNILQFQKLFCPQQKIIILQDDEFSIKFIKKDEAQQFINMTSAAVKKNASYLVMECLENPYPAFTQIIFRNVNLSNLSRLISDCKEAHSIVKKERDVLTLSPAKR